MLIDKARALSDTLQNKREFNQCKISQADRLSTGETLHTYPCGLLIYDYLDGLDKLKEQHLNHHANHNEVSSSYRISISRLTGLPYCSDGCNNGFDIVDKLSDSWYSSCRLETENILDCGLNITQCIGIQEKTIIKGHQNHHRENHRIGIPLSDINQLIWYGVDNSGNCTGYCIGNEKKEKLKDVIEIKNNDCRLAEDTGVLAKFECGLIAPSEESSINLKNIIKMHQRHHDEKHRNNIHMVNRMYKCVCPIANTEKRKNTRKLLL